MDPALQERALPSPPAADVPEPPSSREDSVPRATVSRKPAPSGILRTSSFATPTSPAGPSQFPPNSPHSPYTLSPVEMSTLGVAPPPIIAMTGPSSQESHSDSNPDIPHARPPARTGERSPTQRSPTLQPQVPQVHVPMNLPRDRNDLRAPLERNLSFTGQGPRPNSLYLGNPTAPPRPPSRAASFTGGRTHSRRDLRASAHSLHSVRGNSQGGGNPYVPREALARQQSVVDWIVPPPPPAGGPPGPGSVGSADTQRERTVDARLRPTLIHANDELAKARVKARATGLAINIAIGIEVLLGALTTGIAAAVNGHDTTTVIAVLGGLSTLAASYLARSRGTGQPEASILRCRDLENFIRDLEGFMLDYGPYTGTEYDLMVAHYRRRFEEVLGNVREDGKPGKEKPRSDPPQADVSTQNGVLPQNGALPQNGFLPQAGILPQTGVPQQVSMAPQATYPPQANQMVMPDIAAALATALQRGLQTQPDGSAIPGITVPIISPAVMPG
ncbi:hypothetical protein OBBRIDRAFT_267003 [Obba rivulosa]|uniref:SMODS and SLOG-associating 2TM effector domain-containing protein n=1 Tax=Obba rivulosa TaxID=1052685 RepID=A0A8E2J5I6_9APHY|nr:hypothetical protein OBBRIDRAFT_267003 [Obba rivulosa]